MLNLKIQIPFCQQKISLKDFYLVIICNLNHTKNFIFSLLEKIHIGSETNWKVGSLSEKKSFRILIIALLHL
jgi:hypothetical protein